MNPLISVITPCYNDGRFLQDACDSVLAAGAAGAFEHLIVNDGSTDEGTITKLKELETKGWLVIHQVNQGLAAARNAGLRVAKGKYILPLDCDNRIMPEVMLKAARIMEQRHDLDVTFTDCHYFGEKSGRVNTTDFDLLKILYKNYIDACALIRKDTILRLGGYDGNMPFMGHEDWELWVNIALHGGNFHYLPEIGYHYRVVSNSMVRTQTLNRESENRAYIFRKNVESIGDCYARLYEKQAALIEMDKYARNNRLKAAAKLLFKGALVDRQ